MSDETVDNASASPEAARPVLAAMAPPIVASPAKRIQAFTGDPDFMTSLARGLAVIQAFQERKRHLTIAQIKGQFLRRRTSK